MKLKLTSLMLLILGLTFCASTRSKVHSEEAAQFYKTKEYESAIEAADYALQVSPSNGDAYLYKAKAQYKLRKYKGAMESAEHAVVQLPQSIEARELLANLYLKQGFTQDAKLQYDDLKKIDPNYSNSRLEARLKRTAMHDTTTVRTTSVQIKKEDTNSNTTAKKEAQPVTNALVPKNSKDTKVLNGVDPKEPKAGTEATSKSPKAETKTEPKETPKAEIKPPEKKVTN